MQLPFEEESLWSCFPMALAARNRSFPNIPIQSLDSSSHAVLKLLEAVPRWLLTFHFVPFCTRRLMSSPSSFTTSLPSLLFHRHRDSSRLDFSPAQNSRSSINTQRDWQRTACLSNPYSNLSYTPPWLSSCATSLHHVVSASQYRCKCTTC